MPIFHITRQIGIIYSKKKDKLVLLIRDIFGKRVINASRNLYKILYLGTKKICKLFL